LKDGLPVVEILDLSLPLPPSMKDAIEQEIQVKLRGAERLPMRFIFAEWKDGVVIVKAAFVNIVLYRKVSASIGSNRGGPIHFLMIG
jgi:hypothetical protein